MYICFDQHLLMDRQLFIIICSPDTRQGATAALSQRKTGRADNNWEDTNAEEIQAYIGILIYLGLVDLPEIEDYLQGDFCVCPIVRQAMTQK